MGIRKDVEFVGDSAKAIMSKFKRLTKTKLSGKVLQISIHSIISACIPYGQNYIVPIIEKSFNTHNDSAKKCLVFEGPPSYF